MTSAQCIPSGTRRFLAKTGCVALLLSAAGCSFEPTLIRPRELSSPYKATQVWAIAPFANESGVSTVNTYRVADLFAQQVQQVDGIHAIPVNRVVAAMRANEIDMIATPADAVRLINALNVDAIVVGTVTVWDPYPPPTLGMAVQLFSGEPFAADSPFDPHELVRSPNGDIAPSELNPAKAGAQAAGVFDSRNNQTLAWVEQFAAGRTLPDGAYGKDVFLVNMQLYTQFVSFRLLHDLLADERAQRQPVYASQR